LDGGVGGVSCGDSGRDCVGVVDDPWSHSDYGSAGDAARDTSGCDCYPRVRDFWESPGGAWPECKSIVDAFRRNPQMGLDVRTTAWVDRLESYGPRAQAGEYTRLIGAVLRLIVRTTG